MKRTKQVWDITTEILDNHGDTVDNISIHEHNEGYDFFRKIYHSEGFCIEISKTYICDPEEVKDTHVEDLQNDGYIYEYSEPWDPFKISGINNTIKLLKIYLNDNSTKLPELQ